MNRYKFNRFSNIEIKKNFSNFTFSILIFLSIVFLFGCSFEEKQSFLKDEKVEDSLKQGKLDYYFEDINLTKYDKNGELQSSLKAKKITHFRDSDLVHLEKIKYNFLSKPEWRLRAEKGELNDKASTMLVKNFVEIFFSNGKFENTKISTSILNFDFKHQLAQNDNFTKITNENLNLSGKGIKIDLINKNLELLEKVKGTYRIKNR